NDFQPDIIMGISAGALNSAFLVNESAKMNGSLHWPEIGKALTAFWTEEIRHPQDLIYRQGFLRHAWRIIRKRFNGYYDHEPLVSKVKEKLNHEQMKKSPVDLIVGAVDWVEGGMTYASQKNQDIVDYIIASASMPFILPSWPIGESLFIDGGIRDIVPIRKLIECDIEEVVIILTQAAGLPLADIKEAGSIASFAERVVELVSHEILENDISQLRKINRDLSETEDRELKPLSRLLDKRLIKHTVIRPAQTYEFSLQNFCQEDIQMMIEDGFQAAQIYEG
ncbi:MAG: patatin-like phospholipase family protein, partial [Bacteroidota bacterium]